MCLPDWARTGLGYDITSVSSSFVSSALTPSPDHSHDKRTHTYTPEQLEQGRTHDQYWNAAQVGRLLGIPSNFLIAPLTSSRWSSRERCTTTCGCTGPSRCQDEGRGMLLNRAQGDLVDGEVGRGVSVPRGPKQQVGAGWTRQVKPSSSTSD
eukprot:741327-Hanusia_phi.AAC.8